jgi:hypothetical protein
MACELSLQEEGETVIYLLIAIQIIQLIITVYVLVNLSEIKKMASTHDKKYTAHLEDLTIDIDMLREHLDEKLDKQAKHLDVRLTDLRDDHIRMEKYS